MEGSLFFGEQLHAPRPSRSLSPSPRACASLQSPQHLMRSASDRARPRRDSLAAPALPREHQRTGSLSARTPVTFIPLCPQLSSSQVHTIRKAWKHINTKGLVAVVRRCFQRTESCCPIVAQTFERCAQMSASNSTSFSFSAADLSPKQSLDMTANPPLTRRPSDVTPPPVRTLSEHANFMVQLLQRIVDGDQTVIESLRSIGARHVQLNVETGFGSRQLEHFGEIMVEVFLRLDGIRESKERAWRQLISAMIDCLRDGFEEEARQSRRKNSFNAHSKYFDEIERRHSAPMRRMSLRLDSQFDSHHRKVSNHI